MGARSDFLTQCECFNSINISRSTSLCVAYHNPIVLSVDAVAYANICESEDMRISILLYDIIIVLCVLNMCCHLPNGIIKNNKTQI